MDGAEPTFSIQLNAIRMRGWIGDSDQRPVLIVIVPSLEPCRVDATCEEVVLDVPRRYVSGRIRLPDEVSARVVLVNRRLPGAVPHLDEELVLIVDPLGRPPSVEGLLPVD